MIEIIPAIMPNTMRDIYERAQEVKGLVPWVQIDVMDGDFAPSVSWPYHIEDINEFINMVAVGDKLPFLDELNYEVDLMVSKPEEEIEKWKRLGVKRFLIHVESIESSDVLEYIFVQAQGDVEIGIALGIETDPMVIEPILSEVSVVQCMGIENIGYQGEPFSSKVIDTIEQLRLMDKDVIISVDGGVSIETAPLLIQAGANRLVSGSAVYNSMNIAESIAQLQAFGK